MKKALLFLAAILLCGFAYTQSTVHLQINHMLSGNNFAYGTATTNNLGNDFDVDRLEYYISQLTLIHDGGMETDVVDTFFLVNAGNQLNATLGDFNITNLEGIRFGIGIGQDYNHVDPARYAIDHPLGPKSPSMHWGWTAGYRFVALEGDGGSGLGQIYQVHALEDQNYFKATVNTAGTWDNNELFIAIDGEYEEALYNVDVSAGLINHGGTGEAVTVLENFRDRVFSEGTYVAVGMEEYLSAYDFSIFPNPTTQNSTVQWTGNNLPGAQVTVRDLTGRELNRFELAAGQTAPLNFDESGIYLISLESEGHMIATRKVVVQR